MGVLSRSVYLHLYQLLPIARTAETMHDLFDCRISVATIQRATRVSSTKLVNTEQRIKALIRGSSIIGADETGLRVAARAGYVHIARTEALTHYAYDERRGKAAMDEIGILPLFTDTLVRDGWASYRWYEQCRHSLCNVHLLRDRMYMPPAYILVFRRTPRLPIDAALGVMGLDGTPIRDALTALRLFKGEYVGAGREWTWTSGIPAGIGYGALTVDSLVSSIINGDDPTMTPYRLSVSEIQEVITLYQHLRRSPGRTKLEVALSRFNTSYGRSDYRERVIDLVIALENLFGEETIGQTTEVGYRLRMRVARYLGTNADERKHLKKFISHLYTLRSKIVHGDPKANDEEIQKIFKRPLAEVMTELMDIVRRSLRMLLANPTHIGQEHFNDLLLGIV
jgi:hypothetical protein